MEDLAEANSFVCIPIVGNIEESTHRAHVADIRVYRIEFGIVVEDVEPARPRIRFSFSEAISYIVGMQNKDPGFENTDFEENLHVL